METEQMSHGRRLHHILKIYHLSSISSSSSWQQEWHVVVSQPGGGAQQPGEGFSKSISSSLARESNRNAYLGPTQTHWFRNYGTRNLFLNKLFRSLWHINKFENRGQWWFGPPCPNICCHNMGGGGRAPGIWWVGDRHTPVMCKDMSYGAPDSPLQQRFMAWNGHSAEAEKLCSRVGLPCSTVRQKGCRAMSNLEEQNCPLTQLPSIIYLRAVQHGSPLLRVNIEHLKLTSPNWGRL